MNEIWTLCPFTLTNPKLLLHISYAHVHRPDIVTPARPASAKDNMLRLFSRKNAQDTLVTTICMLPSQDIGLWLSGRRKPSYNTHLKRLSACPLFCKNSGRRPFGRRKALHKPRLWRLPACWFARTLDSHLLTEVKQKNKVLLGCAPAICWRHSTRTFWQKEAH